MFSVDRTALYAQVWTSSLPRQQVFQSVKAELLRTSPDAFWISVSLAERRQMVAVGTSAVPLPIFLAGQVASALRPRRPLARLHCFSSGSAPWPTAPPFCTISLLLSSSTSFMSHFSAFSSDLLATLSHFNVHLMPDGPAFAAGCGRDYFDLVACLGPGWYVQDCVPSIEDCNFFFFFSSNTQVRCGIPRITSIVLRCTRKDNLAIYL